MQPCFDYLMIIENGDLSPSRFNIAGVEVCGL